MKVLIHEPHEFAQKIIELLKTHGVTDVQSYWGKETLHEHMQGIEVLMTEFASAEVIQAGLPSLKFIQGIYRGVDGIDLKAADEASIPVAHTGANIIPTAEHTFGLILAVAKKIVPADHNLRKGKWTYGYYGKHYSTLLHGKTLAVIGLGAIGQEVAKRAQAFGMNVIGVRRTGAAIPGYEVYPPDQLHKVLRQADIIVITTALTPETHDMIGPREFELMKADAILINTSRGRTVDPVALYRALKDKRIAGAGIDVWYNYPSFSKDVSQETVLPAPQPFHELSNIVMTPHRGGFVLETNKAFITEAAENVVRFISGKPPQGLVDLKAGY